VPRQKACPISEIGYSVRRFTQNNRMTISRRFATRLDACRFRLSCLLYKHPLTIPSSVLMVGLIGGMSVMYGVAPRVVATPAPVATAAAAVLPRSDPQVQALSVQLSVLQARADRLESLGQQLVDSAGLADEGFDFGQDPAQGTGDDLPLQDAALSPGMIRADLPQLKRQYDQLEAQLTVLDHWTELASTVPEGMPYASPGGTYQTSSFGGRHDPFGRGRRFHAGIDLAAHLGDPVMAMADGVVSQSGRSSGYGNLVEITHPNGYRTRYGHNSKLLVKVGDRVSVGQVIAKAGSTGRSTGPHIHVEVWNHGQAVNPRPFLERGRQLLAQRRKVLALLPAPPAASNG
jgi:murein DD-endopeptidase MepM/ murein hydrolase activator NlpD